MKHLPNVGEVKMKKPQIPASVAGPARGADMNDKVANFSLCA